MSWNRLYTVLTDGIGHRALTFSRSCTPMLKIGFRSAFLHHAAVFSRLTTFKTIFPDAIF
jgi:hypothetical protein